jgi:hypothetical protein
MVPGSTLQVDWALLDDAQWALSTAYSSEAEQCGPKMSARGRDGEEKAYVGRRQQRHLRWKPRFEYNYVGRTTNS